MNSDNLSMVKSLIFVFTFFISIVYSSGIGVVPVDEEITELTFNNFHSQADALIQKKIAENPKDLKYYYFYISNKMMETIKILDEVDRSKRNLVKDSLNNSLIKYCETLIDRFEDRDKVINDKFYLGCFYGYLGRLYGADGSWLSAFTNGKTGKNLLEEVIEEDPNYYDAYLLLGMFYYYGDRMSGLIGFVAGILGFSGDRDLGFDYLAIAEEKGTITSAQAQMLLAELYSRLESNKEKALPYFQKFTKRFSNNKHFVNWYCRDLLFLDRVTEVGHLIESDEKGLISNFVKGEYYQRLKKYNKSYLALEQFLSDSSGSWRWLKEYAEFTISINNLIQFGTKTSVYNLNEEFSTAFSKIAANKELYEKLLELRYEVTVQKDNQKVNEILSSKINFGSEPYFEAYKEFYAGLHYYWNKDYPRAESSFLKGFKLYKDDIGYRAILYLMSIYENSTVKKERIEEFADIIDDNDFEWLEYRLNDLLEKYNI